MFKVLQKRGFVVEAVNNVGLYTQEQMDEMDERVKELWKVVNETYASLDVYIMSIESMLDDNYSFCGKKWSDEMKKADIKNSCERLKEVKTKCKEVLF